MVGEKYGVEKKPRGTPKGAKNAGKISLAWVLRSHESLGGKLSAKSEDQ